MFDQIEVSTGDWAFPQVSRWVKRFASACGGIPVVRLPGEQAACQPTDALARRPGCPDRRCLRVGLQSASLGLDAAAYRTGAGDAWLGVRANGGGDPGGGAPADPSGVGCAVAYDGSAASLRALQAALVVVSHFDLGSVVLVHVNQASHGSSSLMQHHLALAAGEAEARGVAVRAQRLSAFAPPWEVLHGWLRQQRTMPRLWAMGAVGLGGELAHGAGAQSARLHHRDSASALGAPLASTLGRTTACLLQALGDTCSVLLA